MLISSIPSSSSGPSTSQQPRPIAMPNPASGSASEKSRDQSESTRNSPSPSSPPIVLAIHGGAGGTITPDIPPELQAAYRARLRAALQAGYAVLQQRGAAAGGNALDAVCAAVKVLEDSPLFNAGKGAVFTKDGTVECEASVMVSSPKKESNQGSSTSSGLPALMHSNDWFERGCPADEPLPRSITASSEKHADDPFTCNTSFSTSHIASTRRCAAATLVKGTKNPILLARTLFLSPEEAPHVLLSGQEAEKIGWEKGCVKVDQQYYWTLKRWREHRRGLGLSDDLDDENDGDSPPARLNDRETFPTDCKLPPKTEGLSFSLPSLPPSAHLTPPPSYSSAIREGARDQVASFRPPAPMIEAPESSRRSAFSESGSTCTTPPSSYYGRTPSLSIGSSSASTSGPSVDSTSTDEDNNEYSEPTHPDSSIFEQLSAHFDFNSLPQGTVGACAIDAEGRMAVATSTGGKTNKNSGRVGDTPSVGAGFWAERFDVTSGDKAGARVGEGQRDGEEALTSSWRDLFCGCLSARSKHASQSSPEPAAGGLALSGTGDGDYFLRVSFASLVAHRMRFLGEDSVTAGKKAIDELGKTGGVGGSIVLDHHGNVSFPMNSTTMNRGYISSVDGEKAKVALFPGEELS